MWYIKRRKGKKNPQYLSVFRGWRSPMNKQVSWKYSGKPLLSQWFAELKKFDTQTAANRFIAERNLKKAFSTNMVTGD